MTSYTTWVSVIDGYDITKKHPSQDVITLARRVIEDRPNTSAVTFHGWRKDCGLQFDYQDADHA